MLARLGPDLAYALRLWRLRPGLGFAAIFTIALGVGAVTALFSLVDTVTLRPLPLPSPERVLAVHRVDATHASISQPDAIDLRRRLQAFDAFAVAIPDWSLDWQHQGTPERLIGVLTEAEYFRVVDRPAIVGRLLDAGDDKKGASAVVVLAENFWRRRFDADRGVLGTHLSLSGVDAIVVGVAPTAADLYASDPAVYVSTPAFAPWALGSAGSNNFEAVARAKAGVSVEVARADLRRASAQRAKDFPQGSDKQLDGTAFLEMLTLNQRSSLWTLLGAAVLLLVLAGANVAALLLVRTSTRHGEMALRRALGAGAGRLAQQLLVEGATLAIAGGALGVLFAQGLLRGLILVLPESLPRVAQASVDLRALAVCAGVSLLGALVFSLAPLLHLRRGDHGFRAGRGVGSSASRRTLGAFVALEVAIAVALLGSASLLLRSYAGLAREPLGFDPQHTLVADLVLPESRYIRIEPQSAAVRRIVETLQHTPGVTGAAFVSGLPLSPGSGIGHSLVAEGIDFGSDDPGARYRPFHGDYFGAMRIGVLAGRGIATTDLDDGARPAWVNRRFVETYLKGREPLGQRIAWKPGEASPAEQGPQWMHIVGVVDDVKTGTLRDGDEPAVYAPYLQREDNWIRFGALVARVEGDPLAYRDALQAAVASADSAVPLDKTMSLAQRAAGSLARDRFNVLVVGAFAALAVLLGLQGIFGVVAYAVERRRAELALRIALGAAPAQATALMFRDGMRQALLGSVLGVFLAMVFARLAQRLLFGISAQDPSVPIAAAFAVLCVCALAIWWPARRAAAADPRVALRSE